MFLARSGRAGGDGNPSAPRRLAGCPAGVTPAVVGDAVIYGTGRGRAFHIKTNVPVVAYQMLPFGAGRARVTGATLLLAHERLGRTTTSPSTRTRRPRFSRRRARARRSPSSRKKTEPSFASGPPSPSSRAPACKARARTSRRATRWRAGIPAVHATGRAHGERHSGDAPRRREFPWRLDAHGHPAEPRSRRRRAPNAAASAGPRQRYVGVRTAAVANRTGPSRTSRCPGASSASPTARSSRSRRPSLARRRRSTRASFASGTRRAPSVARSQDAAHPFYFAQYMTGGEPFSGEGDPEFVNVIPPQQFLPRYTLFTDPTYPETELVLVRQRVATEGGLAFPRRVPRLQRPRHRLAEHWRLPDGTRVALDGKLSRCRWLRQRRAPAHGIGTRCTARTGPAFGVTVWGWQPVHPSGTNEADRPSLAG